MKHVWQKAAAAILAIIGGAVMIYGFCVVIMADTLMLGALSAGACCLPVALICWVLAFVLWREAGD